jgi:hypothetical protein
MHDEIRDSVELVFIPRCGWLLPYLVGDFEAPMCAAASCRSRAVT